MARIAHVVGGLGLGGIEKLLVEILGYLQEWGYESDIISLQTGSQHYTDIVKNLGCRVIPCPKSMNPLMMARRLRRTFEINGPYDIAHSHIYFLSGLVMRQAKKAGVPSRIAHMHPLVDVRSQTPLRKFYKSIMIGMLRKYATRIITPTESVRETYKKMLGTDPAMMDVVYSAVRLDRFAESVNPSQVRSRLGLPGSGTIALYVGRFVPHKNHAQLLRVAPQLPDTHFVLAGAAGPTLDYIRKQAAAMGNVSVLPDVDDLVGLMKSSDLFVFPSLNEGFGIVAIEACAAGLPVIAADLPSVREVIPPSHRALMFRPDSDAELLESLNKIRGDDQLREKLVRDAGEWTGRFSVEESTRKLHQIYAEELESNR
ncbi:MAG TPA: glycosyltransferase family 4 protein [Anaerolineales bacterium]|nr:glycosyltransferase family 4 protein [Anaerolineales bacterium]